MLAMTVIDPDLALAAEGGLRLVRPTEAHVEEFVTWYVERVREHLSR